jgi:predicted ATPase/DNA-binding winged helix-turn-helix (wHTH) protein
VSTGPNTFAAREFSFGSFSLQAAERRLLRAGEPVEIGSRALDILIALVERAGEVVGKKGLIARVWPDVIVEEGNLRVHVAALRKVLGDGIDGARYIANVPGRGYSFVAPVSVIGVAATDGQTVSAPATSTSVPDRAHTRVGHGLPARLTRMVGRDAAVAALSEQLRARRFVTVVGPGGLGKTTVAVSVAHLLSAEFANVIFVDLTAVTDAAGVANGLASTLGLTARKEDPTPEILAFLRDMSVLLVLDNCEHVVEAIGGLGERIFVEAPRVHLLATSRELLNVEGEHVYALDPLATPGNADITAEQALEYASVQLFLERAGATGSPISLSDADAPVVAEICQRLDGIALAVELAAGRVSAFGIRGTADLLDKQIGLAWRGRRTALPRHQTLSATLDWSYNLLSHEEQAVLQRLSMFVGDFALAGALAIAGEGQDGGQDEDVSAATEVIETVASLVSKSLVSMRIVEGQPRYRLLEMVRAYAALRLANSGDSASIAARHAKYFTQRCREAEAPDSTAVDPRDLGNIRSALEWSFSEGGDAAIARDLSIAATPILLRWSLLAECRRWSARALETLQDADRGSISESRLIRTLAISTIFTIGNNESLRVQLARGLDLARGFGDQHGQFEFLTGMHAFGARTGNFRGAVSAAAEAADVASDAEFASARWMLCMGHHLLGDQAQALASSEQALSHEAASAAKRKRYFGYDQRTSGLAVRARLLWLTGQTHKALQTAKQAIDEGAALKHPVSYCLTLLYATSVYLWSGRLAEAEQSIERLVDTSSNYLLEPYFAGGQALKGELLHARGEHGAAIPLLSDAAQRLNRERQIAQAPYCAAVLADALRSTAQFGPALDVLDQAMEQRRLGGGSFDLPEMLRIRARILLGISTDNRGAALDNLQCALDLARTQGAVSWALRAALALAELQPQDSRGLIETLVARFPQEAGNADLDAARSVLES